MGVYQLKCIKLDTNLKMAQDHITVLEATGANRVVSCKYQESSLREIKAKG